MTRIQMKLEKSPIGVLLNKKFFGIREMPVGDVLCLWYDDSAVAWKIRPIIDVRPTTAADIVAQPTLTADMITVQLAAVVNDALDLIYFYYAIPA